MQGNHPHRIGLLLLLISSFVLYNWVFDYVIVLQYESSDCFFLFGREFLLQWLDHPGGLLLYASHFLRQFYHYTWLGALVIAVSVTCACASFYLILKRHDRLQSHPPLRCGSTRKRHQLTPRAKLATPGPVPDYLYAASGVQLVI